MIQHCPNIGIWILHNWTWHTCPRSCQHRKPFTVDLDTITNCVIFSQGETQTIAHDLDGQIGHFAEDCQRTLNVQHIHTSIVHLTSLSVVRLLGSLLSSPILRLWAKFLTTAQATSLPTVSGNRFKTLWLPVSVWMSCCRDAHSEYMAGSLKH